MSGYAGEHPEPHADLSSRKPLLYDLKHSATLFRIHPANRHPLFFGKTGDNRFDAPDKSFGMLYLGMDEQCSFIETFGQVTGVRSLPVDRLKGRELAEVKIVRSLRLVDLSNSGGLARIGADAGLIAGPHAISQRWSAALRAHPVKPDGILYPARHDPARRACAIFDCPASTFKVLPRGLLLSRQNSELLSSMLDLYGFGLIP